ncbi:tRNA (N6-isopentenyl adenosine(37)-C2)-methylthiotransferase MiaB [Sulfurimonas sp. HSL-3221]|nr:tRNA (N6-isopentenyl adenosine(37)-C2)-methylthiotransferase MiaB [Sulfurimonas sp. HSL-3221]
MNVRDSEHMIAELSQKEDYALCDTAEEADLILINTCSVREKPVHKLFSELGAFNKKKKADAKIGVCGCTASHLGEEIIKKAPYVNFVLGARNVSKITDVLHRDKAVETEIDYDESQFAFSEFRSSPWKAFINISIGCDKQCTFCIVPKTRGDEISIPADLIVKEAEKAAATGAKEIFLLGQNVNNYGRRFSGEHEKINFTELLRRVSAVEGIERIRFTSPHPFHMDDEFIGEFASNPKICKSIHVPLQSGSTPILKAMKRGYTKEWFLNRIEKLRTMVPDVSISTDVIVAFPGESEADFEETMDVVRQSSFEQMFSFKYSPRPLTEAAEYSETVDPEVASERLMRLQSMHDAMLDEKCKAYLGRTFTVYFEELRSDGYVAGRSDNNILIKVKGSEELLGQFADVRITQTYRMGQVGELVGE